jgi:hypothetical protein
MTHDQVYALVIMLLCLYLAVKDVFSWRRGKRPFTLFSAIFFAIVFILAAGTALGLIHPL